MSVANTERGDSRSNNAIVGLSYVPRGLRFFSDLGNIHNDDQLTDKSKLERIVILDRKSVV